ncbi:MAG: TIGR01777 family oxidoreductase [Phycisphaerae bacterium]|nr:TIGR01777 family oxidoreductase [Phycisphaerae bacterium]
MHILITGSSGLVGSALGDALRRGRHDITSVSRQQQPSEPAFWDIDRQLIHLPQDHPIDAVIHLAGENIARSRWTASQKHRILTSRVQGTRLLCDTLASLEHKPECLISASAVGFYGNQNERALDESSPAGQGFLAEVCQAWETATRPASDAGIRVVHARLGVVLDRQGGMLPRMLLPFRLGLGGPLGHGRQYLSWISLTDVVQCFDFILNQSELQGPVNITSPNPVSNQTFTQALARALHRPAILRVPGFAIEWGLGDLGRELLLSGQNVLPKKLLQAGFEFKHREIQPTLEDILRKA